MKRSFFTIFLIVLSVLMLSFNINVFANSGGYSLLVRKGEVTESFPTSEVTSEEKSIFDNKVVFNNSAIKVNGISLDRFSVTDAQGSLLGPLSFTITGDNTFKVLSISSCSLSVSGTGTLKFVPSAFGEEGIITDVEEQKVFISSRIKTSLPITYEDGYVYINKKVEELSKEPEKENTDSSNEVVNKEESTNKNETSNKEEIKDNTDVNKNENNTVVNDNSDKNNSQSSKPSNDNNNVTNKDDKTDEVINNDVDNNVVTSDDLSVDNSEQESEKDEDINVDSDLSDEIENINDKNNNKKNNISLYVGVGTVTAVGAAGAGVFIFRKMKH